MLPLYSFQLVFWDGLKSGLCSRSSWLEILSLTNVLTPLVLISLGIILPLLAKREKDKLVGKKSLRNKLSNIYKSVLSDDRADFNRGQIAHNQDEQ